MTPLFPLRPGITYRIRGSAYVIKALMDDGTVRMACPVRQGVEVSLTVAELVGLRMSGHARWVGEPVPAKVEGPVRSFDSFTSSQRKVMTRRIAYTHATGPLWPVGPKSPRLKAAIAEIAARRGDTEPPSPHSVYRWLSRFQQTHDTRVFMRDTAYCSQRKPKIAPTTKAVLQAHIEALLSNRPGETLWAITDLALALTARDLGHSTFIDKHGYERPVGDTVDVAEQAFEAKATKLPKSPRGNPGRRKVEGPNQ